MTWGTDGRSLGSQFCEPLLRRNKTLRKYGVLEDHVVAIHTIPDILCLADQFGG